MSFSVRDINVVLGQGASVEFPNGASASFNPKIQAVEPATFNLQAPAASKEYCVFVAPPNPSAATGLLPMGTFQVVGVQACWGTASTSLNVNVEHVASGTADGSGTNILTSNINTAQAAATPQSYALSTNIDLLTLSPGDRLNVITNAGTAGSVANVTVIVYVARVS